MSSVPCLNLGNCLSLDGRGTLAPLLLPAHHLVTHGVIVGMTGSGKTGLLTVIVEEALRAPRSRPDDRREGRSPRPPPRLPLLRADAFAALGRRRAPHPEIHAPPRSSPNSSPGERERGLTAWRSASQISASFKQATSVRVITPGSTAGEPLHVLSSLERRSARWDDGSRSGPRGARRRHLARPAAARPRPRSRRAAASTCCSPCSPSADCAPARRADLAALLEDLARSADRRDRRALLDAFLPASERRALAAALNSLLASPSFESWRSGRAARRRRAGSRRARHDGATPAVIVSVAHLDDDERALVLGVAPRRAARVGALLPGSQRLRALVRLRRGLRLPPAAPREPADEAAARRAHEAGARVRRRRRPRDAEPDGPRLPRARQRRLRGASAACRPTPTAPASSTGFPGSDAALSRTLSRSVQQLAPRWFVMRDVHAGPVPFLAQPRWALSWLRGPMTRVELRKARNLATQLTDERRAP